MGYSIEQWVQPDEIFDLTRRLVRCRTENPPAAVGEAVTILKEILEGNDIWVTTEEFEAGKPNLVSRLKGRDNGRKLLLNGHLDVVTPGDGWTVDPWAAQEQDGRIYGRGTADMKAGLAAMAACLLALKRSAVSFNGEVMLTAVADEETGSRAGTLALLEHGLDADFAIVGEPTCCEVCIGNRGGRHIEIKVKGKSSHASRPFLGRNAAVDAARVVLALENLELGEKEDSRFEIKKPTAAVTMLQGGIKENVIPSECVIVVDRRLIPGETSDLALSQVQALLATLKTEYGIDATVSVRPGGWDPYAISPEEEIARAIVASAQRVTGKKLVPYGKAGCTDASALYNCRQIPTVICGPGDPKYAHKADENVEKAAIIQAAEIYYQTCLSVLSH